jgi:hypothetical protein
LTIVARFDTPASTRDMPAGSPFYDNWHNFIDTHLGPGGQFYNPHRTNVNILAEHSLAWMGFPRNPIVANRDNRAQAFQQVDTVANRGLQEEYCEWHVTRNRAGKITKVVFVTESPEYWDTLWAADPARVLALYRALVSPAVVAADLTAGGGYNHFNRWNTTDGIVHLIQVINTLSAAIGEAKTSIFTSSGFRDNYEEIGLPATNVDPRLQLDVRVLGRTGLMVSLREPIGLYIAGYNDDGWTKPNGSPVGDYWRITRGRPGQILRLEYEVPAGAGFVVGDIRIGGRRIEWGGQIAEHITCTIAGVAGTVTRSSLPIKGVKEIKVKVAKA